MRTLGWLGLLLMLGCVRAAPRADDSDASGWLPHNRDRLEALLASRGRGAQGFDPAQPPVAAFDWDNTMMKNDIGDATFYWMLRHDAVLQPPGRDWSHTSRKLTPAARAALNAACDSAAEPGQPLPTSRVAACADAIVEIYDAGRTPAGEEAWAGQITLTDNAAYQWTAQLTAGHTLEEARQFARAALAENTAAPQGSVQTVGTHRALAGWVRIYPQMRALVRRLQEHGFDVWVVSASPQPFAEVVAAEVGIAADRVIGIRLVLDADQRLTPRVQGCGPAADGEDTIISFNEGKRCWINKVIFAAAPQLQLTRLAPPRRVAFAAGDSDTDVAFVKDADLKLVIDRHKPELMCNAHAGRAGSWLVQPMFLEPLPPQSAPYPCASAKNAAGAPYLDEAGQPIADQRE